MTSTPFLNSAGSDHTTYILFPDAAISGDIASSLSVRLFVLPKVFLPLLLPLKGILVSRVSSSHTTPTFLPDAAICRKVIIQGYHLDSLFCQNPLVPVRISQCLVIAAAGQAGRRCVRETECRACGASRALCDSAPGGTTGSL